MAQLYFLPAIYSMCLQTDNQPWKKQSKAYVQLLCGTTAHDICFAKRFVIIWSNYYTYFEGSMRKRETEKFSRRKLGKLKSP